MDLLVAKAWLTHVEKTIGYYTDHMVVLALFIITFTEMLKFVSWGPNWVSGLSLHVRALLEKYFSSEVQGKREADLLRLTQGSSSIAQYEE